MQPLLDGLEALKTHFEEDEEAIKLVAAEVESAHQWVGENTPDDSAEKPPRKLGKVVRQISIVASGAFSTTSMTTANPEHERRLPRPSASVLFPSPS